MNSYRPLVKHTSSTESGIGSRTYWATKEKRIMQSLREFFTSSSGLVPARQGLGLGWVISALTGITVLLGAKEAEADTECDRTWDTCSRSSSCATATKGRELYRYCSHSLDVDCNYSRGSCWCSSTSCP